MQDGQETSVRLPNLPTGIVLESGSLGRVRYDARRQMLVLRGIMEDDLRDRLLQISSEHAYQQAIHQLYRNSRAGKHAAPVVIETRNLTKVYRDFWGRQKVRALRALDLQIYRGEVFGLLGPNGSGKTTTIKLLLGLLFPTEGEALVLGRPATDVNKNERIGYLPEESYLYRFLNAEETLDFYGRLFNMPAQVRRRRADALIKRVGLTGARHRPLKEYSKGMTRRIGLAQALINDPDLILLDEPTTGFDPIGTREMKDMILELKEQGKTVVMCSHQLSDVQDVCDRIAILHQGELKELGRVEDLISVQDVVQIRARNLAEHAQQEIESVLRKHGVEFTVEHPTTTLEELFLRIVRESEERPGRRITAASLDRQPFAAAEQTAHSP